MDELLPAEHRAPGVEYVQGRDTLDVWFDSGSSWYAALQPRLSGFEDSAGDGGFETVVPASVYAEGSDQHRGWFQSSLLTAVACTGAAPYKQIISHGFVLDETGRKMSKSLGNVVDPAVVIDGGQNKKKQPAYGADVLRVWVASTDFTKDVRIGATSISAASELLRKLRNTLRFLLANLEGYDPASDAVPPAELAHDIDRLMLAKLAEAAGALTEAYDANNLAKAVKTLGQLCTTDLSQLYFDVAKDRLYCDPTAAHSRRSVQTVLHAALGLITAGLAPVAPFTAEDVYAFTPTRVRMRLAECLSIG